MLTLLIAALTMVYPAHTGLVTDSAHQLTAQQDAALEQRLLDYERRTGIEFTVVIIPSLNGEVLEPYANGLFHEWGIGKKDVDNGVLLLWAVGNRQVRIEVGYGLEERLPDGRAGQIIRENILPRFRNQDWIGGVSGGVDAVITQLDRVAGQPTVIAQAQPNNTAEMTIVLLIVIGLLGLGTVIYIIFIMGGDEKEDEQRRLKRRQEENELYTRSSVKNKPHHHPFIPMPDDHEFCERCSQSADNEIHDFISKKASTNVGIVAAAALTVEEEERHRRKKREEDEEDDRRRRRQEEDSSRSSSSSSNDSSSSSSDSGGGFGGFGGGDSGGGGASGSY